VLRRLLSQLHLNELFVPVQSAYRPGHSPETALLKMINDLRLLIDRGFGAILTMLDLSSAFDTVNHQILLSRLERLFGVSGTALSWFQSYLSGRTQSVRIIDASSGTRDLEFGVPQGSVLGPILFLLYIAPIYDILRRHGIDAHFLLTTPSVTRGLAWLAVGLTNVVLSIRWSAAFVTWENGSMLTGYGIISLSCSTCMFAPRLLPLLKT